MAVPLPRRRRRSTVKTRSDRTVSDTPSNLTLARFDPTASVSTRHYVSLVASRRHWVIVASREHARRGVSGGFAMANHGKRSPLARMSPGDGILIYSPTTTYPNGEPLRAVTSTRRQILGAPIY